jgi:hypothetical protein
MASDKNVSRLDIGAMIDKIGIRITDCQLGCFKVSKTAYQGAAPQPVSDEVTRHIETLSKSAEFTCKKLHDIARELHVKPISIAEAVNVKGCKIQQCQLGCF